MPPAARTYDAHVMESLRHRMSYTLHSQVSPETPHAESPMPSMRDFLADLKNIEYTPPSAPIFEQPMAFGTLTRNMRYRHDLVPATAARLEARRLDVFKRSRLLALEMTNNWTPRERRGHSVFSAVHTLWRAAAREFDVTHETAERKAQAKQGIAVLLEEAFPYSVSGRLRHETNVWLMDWTVFLAKRWNIGLTPYQLDTKLITSTRFSGPLEATVQAALARHNGSVPEIPHYTEEVDPAFWPHHFASPPQCANCSVPVLRDGLRRPATSEQSPATYCASCAQLLRRCAHCSSVDPAYVVFTPRTATLRLDSCRLTPEQFSESERICHSCAQGSPSLVRFNSLTGTLTRREYAARLAVVTFLSYSAQPSYTRSLGTNEKDGKDLLLFGVELECGVNERVVNESTTLAKILDPTIYFKRDGSVRGFEMISHPFSWRYWQEFGSAAWMARLESLRKDGVRSYNFPNCGMHVHMSAAAFTPLQTLRVLELVYNNQTLFQQLSQRAKFDYCRFNTADATNAQVRMALAKGRASLRMQMPRSYAARALQGRLAAGSRSGVEDRHVAVNLPSEKPTIELRIFRGTLHGPSFAKNVELCHAIWSFTRVARTDAIALSAAPFLGHIYANNREYPNLCAFLDRWYKVYRPTARTVPEQYKSKVAAPKFELADAVLAENS